MKRVIMTMAIVLGMVVASFAQGGLFGHGQSVSDDNTATTNTIYHRDGTPGLPGHGGEGNQPAPVGSGIAVLVGLGAAYAYAKKRED